MKLDRRLEVLEAGSATPYRFHAILVESGFADDAPEVWAARDSAALAKYDEVIAPDDTVCFVRFVSPEHLRGEQS